MEIRVQLKDGSYYDIPQDGPRGSFAWAREASLIATAYNQVGNGAEAAAWQKEYTRRILVWERVQAGEDLQSVLRTIDADRLAPLRIVANVVPDTIAKAGDAAGKALEGAGDAVKAAGESIKFLPVILVGILVVLGIGLYRGSLGIKL